MLASHSEKTLDAVLALQFMVAWAGEGRCEPKRLGWWDTDLIDDAGGGDFLARLLPRTHAWASLEAAREAARRTDAKARSKMADPDALRSLFFLGFELDEKLADRLAALKRGEPAPGEALQFPLPLTANFDRDRVEAVFLQPGSEAPTVVPGGRQLKGAAPSDPEKLAQRLVAALHPFSDQYPLPFFKVAR